MNKDIFKEEMRTILVKEVATHYIETKDTIRNTANLFGKSKSWIHNILKTEVSKKCPSLIDDVNKTIKANKQIGQIKGGETTKDKYKKGDRNQDVKTCI